ncbi:hypothetical protein EDD11_004225 [Mortierella claussenii]|nr:hypothetical protein EDD11_004225 [Mortierella claussenii]
MKRAHAHNYGHPRNSSSTLPTTGSTAGLHASYEQPIRVRRRKRQSQKQPSFEVIDSTPHSDLYFYDMHLDSQHSGADKLAQDHLSLLKRRRSRKYHHRRHQQQQQQQQEEEVAGDNRGSRDTYADLVIVFKYKSRSHHYTGAKGSPSKQEAEQETLEAYQDVLNKLTQVGLQYETRPSGRETILIFVLCPWSILKREVVRNSIHDWLTGVKVADTIEAEQLLQPAQQRDHSLDGLTDADRIRLIHELIIGHPNEGGAGIYPDDEDGFVNSAWLKKWSTKWVVDHKELCRIRNHFGEKVAYYFEFLQFYFLWLIVPTALGVLIHLFGSPFSIVYSISVIIWAIVFIESWKRREKELALWWGVRNVKKSESRRQAFKGDSVIIDPITDEQMPFFSPWKRWARKIAGLPVILAGAFVLSILVTFMFVVEVFLEVYYGGYMKEILVYAPTVLFTLAMPYVEEMFNGIAEWLTDFENHETDGSYDYHLVQKLFIFKVLNSYLSILLTAYVYIPFGPHVIGRLQAYGLPFATVAIEPRMLQDRLQAFMISNQVISFFSETILPWATRRLMKGAVVIQKEVAEVFTQDDNSTADKTGGLVGQDPEHVKRFLKSVQAQVELPVYDVNEDYGEMVDQFGYITLFSVIWPLTSLCAFINNWIELRSDAAKICFHTRRPLPSRTDSIGPWIENLEHLTWFSSLTNASILYLFRGSMAHHQHQHLDNSVLSESSNSSLQFSTSILLLCLLASEHVYLGLRWIVRTVLESIPTAAEVSVRRKEYGVKRSWLTRLNDAIGSTFGSVVRLSEDAERDAKGVSSRVEAVSTKTGDAPLSGAKAFMDDSIKQQKTGDKGNSINCMTSIAGVGVDEGVFGLGEATNVLQSDLGAQAIRSMFKVE